MGVYTSRIVEEIGENGSQVYGYRDLEITAELLLKKFPDLKLEPFKKYFAEAKSLIEQEKARSSKVSLQAVKLKDMIGNCDCGSKLETAAPEIISWLATNKVFEFYCTLAPGLDQKNFSQDGDGNWKVADAPQGSRLTKFDTLIDVLDKGKDHPVTGKTGEQLSALLKMRSNYPHVRIHRQTHSKKQMYEALRLPPPSIKMTLWDMDLCLLKIHTGGFTNSKIQVLSKQVTEAYVYLMDIMTEKSLTVGVVTFSDKQVAARSDSNYGGEELVRPLVFHALRRHWMQQDRSLKLEDAIRKARTFVETNLYVKAAYPEFRNKFDPEFKDNPMPSSKEWHIGKVAEEYKSKTGSSLLNPQVILFDDGERNISEANKSGVIGIQVDEDVGFSVKDWEEAMDLAWSQYLESLRKGASK